MMIALVMEILTLFAEIKQKTEHMMQMANRYLILLSIAQYYLRLSVIQIILNLIQRLVTCSLLDSV